MFWRNGKVLVAKALVSQPFLVLVAIDSNVATKIVSWQKVLRSLQ